MQIQSVSKFLNVQTAKDVKHTTAATAFSTCTLRHLRNRIASLGKRQVTKLLYYVLRPIFANSDNILTAACGEHQIVLLSCMPSCYPCFLLAVLQTKQVACRLQSQRGLKPRPQEHICVSSSLNQKLYPCQASRYASYELKNRQLLFASLLLAHLTFVCCSTCWLL